MASQSDQSGGPGTWYLYTIMPTVMHFVNKFVSAGMSERRHSEVVFRRPAEAGVVSVSEPVLLEEGSKSALCNGDALCISSVSKFHP